MDDPITLRAYQPRVRPDGYGVWTEGERTVPFFLEYDSGGEQLAVLTGKLTGYRDLFRTLGRAWPVLFWLHSTARERHLRRRLDELPTMALVATGARDDASARRLCPAGPVWAIAGTVERRLRLIHLPSGS